MNTSVFQTMCDKNFNLKVLCHGVFICLQISRSHHATLESLIYSFSYSSKRPASFLKKKQWTLTYPPSYIHNVNKAIISPMQSQSPQTAPTSRKKPKEPPIDPSALHDRLRDITLYTLNSAVKYQWHIRNIAEPSFWVTTSPRERRKTSIKHSAFFEPGLKNCQG